MLKKSLLLASAAASIAASVAAPAHAAEVRAAAYADLRYGIDYFDDKASSPDVNFDNHGSYFGAKGSAEQGGIVAFGGYERWLDADATNGNYDLARQAYAGVKTAYGTLEFGTFGTAYMEAGRKLDPFYATAAAGVGRPVGLAFGGQSHGQSALAGDGNANSIATAATIGGAGFVANQLAYTSPALFGVTLNAAVMFDDNTTTAAADDFAGGVEWNQWGITAGAQVIDANAANTNTGLAAGTEAYRGYASYAAKSFGGGVSAERIDLPSAHNQDYIMASGWYGVMDGLRAVASYGLENETAAEGTSFRVGAFYDVLDNFTTHIVYRNFNGKGAVPDDQVVSIGATFKFELSGGTTTR